MRYRPKKVKIYFIFNDELETVRVFDNYENAKKFADENNYTVVVDELLL